MKKKVIRAVILSCALFGFNSTNVLAAEVGSYVYAGANVNIRENPEDEVIGTLPYNAQGVLLEEDEYGWYKIQSGDVIGYVASQYLGDEPFSKGYTKATVNSNGLKVRTNTNEGANVLEVLEPNTSAEVTKEYDGSDWISVVTDNGNYGYVNANYVTLNTYYPTAIRVEDNPVVVNQSEVIEAEPQEVQEVYETEDTSYDEIPVETYEENISYDEPQTESYDYNEEQSDSYDEEEYDSENINEEETSQVEEDAYYEEEVSQPEEDVYYEEETPQPEEIRNDNSSSYYSSTGESIAATVSGYVGCSYVWGATGPDSFDCSGLVSYVFSSYGISVPRTAADQYYGGTQIDVSTAVSTPGALIFYHGLGHVAISLGDGSVVHASNSSTGVIISDAYYSTPDGAAIYF